MAPATESRAYFHTLHFALHLPETRTLCRVISGPLVLQVHMHQPMHLCLYFFSLISPSFFHLFPCYSCVLTSVSSGDLSHHQMVPKSPLESQPTCESSRVDADALPLPNRAWYKAWIWVLSCFPPDGSNCIQR